MSDSEEKALELMVKAEKILARSKLKDFILSVFGRGPNNLKAAIECYQKAGANFTKAKNWNKAGEAFANAAELLFKNRDRENATANFVHAGKCYRRIDHRNTLSCFEKAIDLYLELCDFGAAAKIHQSCAMISQKSEDLQGALFHFQQAADYFSAEDFDTEENFNIQGAGFCAGLLENYAKAVKIYEDLALSALEKDLNYKMNEYFFKASICHLCVDVKHCQEALRRYVDLYPEFEDTEEYKLMKDASSYAETKDADEFYKRVQSWYDAEPNASEWCRRLLFRVWNTLTTKTEIEPH